jgi:hypothetical protein
MRAIKCITTGETFKSIREAADKYGLNEKCIGHVLSGKNKTAGGYTFSYLDETNKNNNNLDNKDTVRITVTNASTVTAAGNRTHGNCKPVLCITTGVVYASSKDAGEKLNINRQYIARSARCNGTTYGMKFCFLNKSDEHLDEITSTMREKTTVIMPKVTQTVIVKKPDKKKSFNKKLANFFFRIANKLVKA